MAARGKAKKAGKRPSVADEGEADLDALKSIFGDDYEELDVRAT